MGTGPADSIQSDGDGGGDAAVRLKCRQDRGEPVGAFRPPVAEQFRVEGERRGTPGGRFRPMSRQPFGHVFTKWAACSRTRSAAAAGR